MVFTPKQSQIILQLIMIIIMAQVACFGVITLLILAIGFLKTVVLTHHIILLVVMISSMKTLMFQLLDVMVLPIQIIHLRGQLLLTLAPVSAMSPFNSTTVNDGYLFFSSAATGGGDNDGTPHYVRATNTTPINLTYQDVVISFENNYRWWQDTRGVRVSGDNGATWYQYELTNSSPFQTGFQNNQSSGNPEMAMKLIFLQSQEISRKC